MDFGTFSRFRESLGPAPGPYPAIRITLPPVKGLDSSAGTGAARPDRESRKPVSHREARKTRVFAVPGPRPAAVRGRYAQAGECPSAFIQEFVL